MTISLTLVTVAFTLSVITAGTAWFLNMRSQKDREKLSPFECGFDPKNSARIPFSLRFFLLGIIFIVFDIEIVLAIPIPLLFHLTLFNMSFWAVTVFMFILLLGLIHEWKEGSLNWT